jgi:hypothetical protein
MIAISGLGRRVKPFKPEIASRRSGFGLNRGHEPDIELNSIQWLEPG